MIILIVYLGIKDIENYSTPTYIPLVSFIISVIYFCNMGYIKITKSNTKENVKSNLRGLYLFAGAILSISCLIYWVVADSILSPVSDILTIISIVLTISAEFLTTCIVNYTEKNDSSLGSFFIKSCGK